jgi:hypothetical protein
MSSVFTTKEKLFFETYPRSSPEDKKTWIDFEGFINVYEIDTKISKPEVFDIIRQNIYTQNLWFDTTSMISQLNKLSNEDLHIMIGYMMFCRATNQINQNIQLIIPCEVVDFILSRFAPSL